ncbi:protein FAR1-RELATED SEQUENCE 5-like [Salvia splendens]|uniref:protein FAR1-RELATED SEQUENCE 5-like n=1 Tax=Salvia splendens TaxID=180675 RepID=UPI001C26EC38|nr:protein FAR1-RELATED SEQUENCE 5-like [Salvia splendens]
MEEGRVVPACSEQIKPVVGQRFESLEFAHAFYDVYARVVGFDTRKQDCAGANIGPSLTFKLLTELMGDYESVGCTVLDIRNYTRDIKRYAEGCDAQMIIDELKKKKENCDAFTYEYEVDSLSRLIHLFWCDPIAKMNFLQFGDIVSFDTTYSTNRYSMIFAPFTGKDNHGRAVSFGAGLLCGESADSFSWLFKQFVKCMGIHPKLIITDQDLGMKVAVEKVLVNTRHRWCMWHIMAKVAEKVPKSLIGNTDFKKDLNLCVWSELIEPTEFEDKWMNVMETYDLVGFEWFQPTLGTFLIVLDAQRNYSAKLDYMDYNTTAKMKTEWSIEKHASTIFTDGAFKEIQEQIMEAYNHCSLVSISNDSSPEVYKVLDHFSSTWSVTLSVEDSVCVCGCKMFSRTALAVHGVQNSDVATHGYVDEKKKAQAILLGEMLGLDNKSIVREARQQIFANGVVTSTAQKKKIMKEFYGAEAPQEVDVQPPEVVSTKGCGSRLPSRVEKALKLKNKPMRQCKKCQEWGHHDSRNCDKFKEKEKMRSRRNSDV